jgi:hypothetical protein
MSTLVTNTITGLSTAANITIGSTPVVSASANSLTIRGEGSAQTSIQQGLCKCWTQIDGTGTIAARDSFNVTSLTDNGTGDYTITIANDMANDDYAVLQNALYPASRVLHVGDDGSGFAIAAGSYRQLMSYTTGNNGEATAADADYVMTTFHGDLA